MKDLQNYLDELPLEEINEMIETCNEESPQKERVLKILNFLKAVYESEMDVEFTLDDKLIKFITDGFGLKLTLYTQVRIGDIVIADGRLSLINDSAKFKITEQGIKKVEAMIK